MTMTVEDAKAERNHEIQVLHWRMREAKLPLTASLGMLVGIVYRRKGFADAMAFVKRLEGAKDD